MSPFIPLSTCIDISPSVIGLLISKDNFIEEDDMVKLYNVGYQLYYGYKR